MVLGISERQSFRLKARIRKEGVAGIIHGNRGHRSPFVSWAHKAVEVHVHDRLARFDAHTTRTVGVYRTNGRREVVSSMGLTPRPLNSNPQSCWRIIPWVKKPIFFS